MNSKNEKILQGLKDCFKNTPREEIQANWDATREKCKGVKSPTVSEFLEVTKSVNEFSVNPKFYFNPLVDKEPVPVKIIQEVKRKDYHKIEINRDFNGRAGFWVNPGELKDSPNDFTIATSILSESSFSKEWNKDKGEHWDKL